MEKDPIQGMVEEWMDRIQNARISELCEMRKGLDKRIDEGFL